MAIGTWLVVAFWPLEAKLGTYGSYTLSRKGYTVAKEINVGSYSDPSHEGEVYRTREQGIDQKVQPLLPMYDAWFARLFDQKHPYGGWLDALERNRTTTMQWDYKSRLPGPHTIKLQRVESPSALALPSSDFANGEPPQVYLHMKPNATQLEQGRALIGVALAQAFLGDTPTFQAAVPQPADWTLAQRLAHAVEGDSFRGQPMLIAAVILAARSAQPELEHLVDDNSQSSAVRLCARLIYLGLRHEEWHESDWPRLEAATHGTDRRTLWTWMLVFVPSADAAAREAELRTRLPLSKDDEDYFYREYVRGKQH